MKTTQKCLLLLGAALFSTLVYAQKCDPWITQAYQQLYGRGASASECNIRNYNNGSWSSYPELVGFIAGFNRNKPGDFLKGDPWIFRAYMELYNRAPIAWELNIQNYNNGSWSNYNNLKGYIQQYHAALQSNGLAIKAGVLNGKPVAVLMDEKNNQALAINLVTNDGGQLIAAGGGNVVSAGGGNVVSAGGGNVVSAGGGNVVSAGGGNLISAGGGNLMSITSNLTIQRNLAGITFGSARQVMSAGSKVIATAGQTKLVIR